MSIPGLKAIEKIINDAILNVYKEFGKKVDKEFYARDLTKKIRTLYVNYLTHITQYVTLIGYSSPVEVKDLFVESELLKGNREDWSRWGKKSEDFFSDALLEELRRDGKSIPSLSINDERVLITGPPGAGKSTLAKFISLVACGKIDKIIDFTKNKLPFFIAVKDLSQKIPVGFKFDWRLALWEHEQNPKKSYFDYLKEDLGSKPVSYIEHLMAKLLEQARCQHTEEFVEHLLSHGKCCIIIDGIDEANDELSEVLIGSLTHLSASYQGNSILVLSRPRAVPDGIYGFKTYSMLDFDTSRWMQSINKWFNNDSKAKELINIISNDTHFQEIAGNPLLVSILCVLYERNYPIPKKKSDLYNRCIDALMYELDRAKGFRRQYIYDFINEQKRKDIFSIIAFNMQKDGKQYTTIKDISNYLEKINFLSDISDKGELHLLLQSLELEHGIIFEWSKDVYVFPHRTFQEFLAAWYIERSRKEIWFIEALKTEFRYEMEWWREVAIILAHLLLDATDYLRNLMNYAFELRFKQSLLSEILIQDISCDSSIYETAKERGFIIPLEQGN